MQGELVHRPRANRGRARLTVSLAWQVIDANKFQPGKHGHAKISITATDVASGRKVERNLRADERVTVPGKRWIMAVSPVEVAGP